ncbi:hypothetical protein TRFO_03083 [Tritrichomonas foetus]|uniref:Uncharacterized protein n=1 Tax=Tritrichomonas foetus TaxID=1144522 RepID=A0A1J4KU42_9EUKA|nr:hypothetical protein TRFO_03083 [Tritrichomonas foetus]|eukprot:OHT14787.1 hypothetical protein TRFO_03083 [Tritrichomonas foetus]
MRKNPDERLSFNIFRNVFYVLSICLGLIIIIQIFTIPKCNSKEKTFDLQSLKKIKKSYQQLIYILRNELKHTQKFIYLNNADKILPLQSTIREMANSVHDISDEKFFLTKKNEITNFLLSYFGANSHQYSVIYRSSYESALYFLGESLQWDENSYLFLHQDSSQSVLGLRHYINHSKNIKIFDTQNLSLCTKSGNNNATNFVFIPLVEGFAGNVINISKLHLDTTSCKYKIIGDASLAFTINPINLSEINIEA